ncbi:MAG: HD domain-containing protein, partial [Dehalococcoidia bacterium]
CTDINELKLGEEALRKSENLYRSLFDNMLNGFAYCKMLFDQDQPRDFIYLVVNEAFEKQTGLKDVTGKKVSEVIPGIYETDPQLLKSYGRVALTGIPEKLEIYVAALKMWFSVSVYSPQKEYFVSVFDVITERKQNEAKLAKSYESLKKTLNDAIDTIAKIVETRDPYTAGHQQRVADLANAIAHEMKLEDSRIDQIRMAAVIHDIGKMYVPSEILSKPGKLSAMEFNLIKTHAQAGYDIVKGIDLPCSVAKAILQHHERPDGSGYPNQLMDDDIIMEAKILAVADVIEAMASHRPYRPALGIDKALDEILQNRGILYDPDVVDACVQVFNRGRFEFKSI